MLPSHFQRGRHGKTSFIYSSSSHLHTQQVAQAHLSDIVADKLVVLQASVGDFSVAWLLLGVGLFTCQSKVSCPQRSKKNIPSSHPPAMGAGFLRLSIPLDGITQLGFAEQQERLAAGNVRAAVVGGL